MLGLPRRGTGRGPRLSFVVPGLFCALATHGVLYRSLWPGDGVHGYFGWYEPLVAVLSLLALVGLAALVGAAMWGGGSSRARGWVRRFLAGLGCEEAPRFWRGAATTALLILVTQESVERSVAVGSPGLAVFSASSWLTIVTGVLAFAGLLALVARAAAELVLVALRRVRRAPASFAAPLPWRPVVRSRRLSPLAVRRGLRAPPLLAG